MVVLHLFLASGFSPPKPWGRRRRKASGPEVLYESIRTNDCVSPLPGRIPSPDTMGQPPQASGQIVLSATLRPNDGASYFPGRIPSPETMGPPPQASGPTVLYESLRPNDGGSPFPGFWLPSPETMGPPPQAGLRSRSIICKSSSK